MKMHRFCGFLLLTILISFNALAQTFGHLKTQVLFPSTPMYQSYIGEDVPGHAVPVSKGVEKIIYLTDREREQYRVVIDKGIAYRTDSSPYQMHESKINYVLDSAGNIYFFENEVRKELRHSSILAGAPVAAAGEMTVDKHGKILSVNRKSGHYKPAQQFFDSMLQVLSDSGVDLERIAVTGSAK